MTEALEGVANLPGRHPAPRFPPPKPSPTVRTDLKLDGHHVQFNLVNPRTMRDARAEPERYRDLIVRVAGYSDDFCDLSLELQEEIIARIEHQALT
jgi:autonomous glycyl radical cofactor GrcA